MAQLKKTAKGLDVVFKIISGLAMAGIIVLAAVNAIGLILGYDRIVDKGHLEIGAELNGVILSPEDLVVSVMDVMHAVLLISAIAIVGLFSLWYGLRIVRRILAPMKEGQPFSSEVSGNFRRLGWFVIAVGILRMVFEGIGKDMVAKALIDRGAGSVVVGISHNIDLSFIIIAFVFFLCSYIFRYGEELQKLSDETV